MSFLLENKLQILEIDEVILNDDFPLCDSSVVASVASNLNANFYIILFHLFFTHIAIAVSI